MEALKFLRPGRMAPFTGVTWPPPGQWLASAAPAELCRAGVHALLADGLATWTAEELWRVELDGARELAPAILVASRGRLLGRVEAWKDHTAREFARPAPPTSVNMPRGAPPSTPPMRPPPLQRRRWPATQRPGSAT